MPSAWTASAIDPPTAMFPSALSCALTALSSTEKHLACTSATSSRYSQRAGTLTRSAASRLVATNACLNSWQTIRSREMKSPLSTARLSPYTTAAGSRTGLVGSALRMNDQRKTGVSSSPRRMSNTRYQTKPAQPMSQPKMASSASGPI